MLAQWGKVSISSQEVAWTRPNLSANGTWGNDSFAVKASSEYAYSLTYYAWRAVDGATGTNDFWEARSSGTAQYYFYNPTAIKVKAFSITNPSTYSAGCIRAGQLLGSNDDITYTPIKSFTSDAGWGAQWTITTNSTECYKYHKIDITSTASAGAGYGNNPGIAELALNAVTEVSVLNSITFPYSHYSSNSYSPYIFLYGGGGECYVSSRTKSGMSLSNNSTATYCLYGTIGY